MLAQLQEIPAWLGLFVAIGGAVVCLLNLGRSRWAMLLLAGFVAETITLAFTRVVLIAMRSGALDPSSIGIAFFGSSLLGLIGSTLVVVGLAGVFSDLRRSP